MVWNKGMDVRSTHVVHFFKTKWPLCLSPFHADIRACLYATAQPIEGAQKVQG